MKRKNPNKNEVAAEWATSLEPDARKFFGSITIEPDLRIHFPILKGHGDIPFGTTVFWGVRDNLERCTAITLPSGPAGSHTGPTGHSLFLDGIVTHLLIGRVHVPDPSAQFVKKLIFTPHPNSSLHVLRLLEWIQPKKDILDVTFASDCEPNRKAITTSHSAYFVPERGPLFNIAIPQAKATVTAWIGGNLSGILEEGSQSRISFGIDFEDLQHLDSALDEANRLCTFLSFTAHQYIYPSDFRIVLENEQVACTRFG